jgi:macrodomain Ter protein organizer (MatP/YcbG family)
MAYVPANNFSNARRGQSRSFKRISITLNYATYKALEDRSSEEGRSISNLAAYLLERSLTQETNEDSP